MDIPQPVGNSYDNSRRASISPSCYVYRFYYKIPKHSIKTTHSSDTTSPLMGEKHKPTSLVAIAGAGANGGRHDAGIAMARTGADDVGGGRVG